jgi:hypothetical protein
VARLALALVLASQLALGADPVADGGTPQAIAVESATLRPLDAPVEPVEVGRGVYLPESLAVEVAAKTAAYDAATPGPVSSPVVWLVVGALVLGVGGGFALGWAARPTAAQ